MPFQNKEEFRSPELKKRIIELRTQGLTLKKIQDKIKEEFNLDISLPTITKIYEIEIAKASFQAPELTTTIKTDYNEVHERYQKVVKMVDDLVNTFEKLKNELSTESYLKYAPIMIAISREVLNQLDFIRKEQERITIQQKNLIYSPIQIINVIDKQIREYEKKGLIKVLMPLPSETKENREEE